jgi:hypothetical protein
MIEGAPPFELPPLVPPVALDVASERSRGDTTRHPAGTTVARSAHEALRANLASIAAQKPPLNDTP